MQDQDGQNNKILKILCTSQNQLPNAALFQHDGIAVGILQNTYTHILIF